MFLNFLLTIITLTFYCPINTNNNNIIINKYNVIYSFVPCDPNTDNWVINAFPTWESETFEIFEKVKDPQGIAIDIGAWIGTTAIWLSKNFNHVIAVDADKVSLQCLKNNLQASECFNVTICDQPVTQVNDYVIFGSRGETLNQSISYVKNEINNVFDYEIQGITLKELIQKFVYENDDISNKKISFIKCDIEGGEEDILEDILNFAYFNNVKVYMSFHYDWWKNKNIEQFDLLFKKFKSNCPDNNVIEHIKKNPFDSILFESL